MNIPLCYVDGYEAARKVDPEMAETYIPVIPPSAILQPSLPAKPLYAIRTWFLGGLVAAAIIEGFSTLISKSFRIRSRIAENGVHRLKQNLLQLLEQYLPGGIEPGGDAWKLSLRIRLVHA